MELQVTKKSLEAYTELCALAGREPIAVEYMAMAMFGVKPDWLIELEKA